MTNLPCGHSPGNSWPEEQAAWQAAERLARSQALPFFARQCSLCKRWSIHINWKAR